jgi:hypothetical protein
MLMPKINLSKSIDSKNNRNFGLIMAFVFIFFGVLKPLMKHSPINRLSFFGAGILILISLFRPNSLKKIRSFWILFGEKIGAFNSKIIFTILYFSLFSVLHLIFILMKRDKMKKDWKRYQSTYELKNRISDFNDPF